MIPVYPDGITSRTFNNKEQKKKHSYFQSLQYLKIESRNPVNIEFKVLNLNCIEIYQQPLWSSF